MIRRRFLPLLAATLAAPFLSSCSIIQEPGAAIHAYRSYDRPARLPENPGNVQVKVSIGRQRAYVVEGENVLLAMPVTVGSPGHPTPRGHFRIFAKDAKKRATSHGYAYSGDKVRRGDIHNRPPGWKFKGTPLPYWCEFKPGYAFHTGWIKHFPSTQDGCIRLHENLAPKFFRLVKVGTPVHIAYSQPEDKTHGHIPLPPDAGPLPDHPHTMYTGEGYFTHHLPPRFE